MNHASKLLMSLLAATLVTGCASQATLQVHSEPQGAYISDDSGRLLGTTPLEIAYPLDANSGTCVETGNLTAHWVSGVEEEVRSLLLCEPGYVSTRITRDFSQPGLAEDREFALQLEMLQLQQEQTYAAQQAADAAWAEAAAIRDAVYAERWSRRGRNGGSRNYDRDYDRDRNDGDRDYDRERDDGNREEPATYVVSMPDAVPASAEPFIDPAALQAASDRAVQAAAEQLAAEATAEVEAEPAQAHAEEAATEQESADEESTRFDDEDPDTVKPEIAEE